MDKQKFAKYFYIGSLIIAIVLFAFGRRLIGPKKDLLEEYYIRYSNLILFIVFAFLLPLGVLVREFFMVDSEKVNKKIMIIKVIVFVLVIAVGLALFFAVPTITTSNIIMYLAYGSLIFALIPSDAMNKKIK